MSISQQIQKIDRLKKQIAQCRRCDLHLTRTHTVPGEGDVEASIMLIGEAPGKNEDEQGKPFVGRAGGILDQLLSSVNLTRNDIYLCNILKCRPPNNRNPLASEIASCAGSLDIQIKIVDPRVIGTLGTFATAYIFEKFHLPPATISTVAGKKIEINTAFGPKIIVPLFHPAVATYNPTKIDVLKRDFKILKKLAGSQN
ncbi:MAG: uracil-DNA glycosylase [Candidatus Omnitrophica bacterium]|nr:uracil-DNA glycosylase [Candidatus Omnitrophota bacterium]